MSKPRVGTKNVPLVIWLFSLTLLLLPDRRRRSLSILRPDVRLVPRHAAGGFRDPGLEDRGIPGESPDALPVPETSPAPSAIIIPGTPLEHYDGKIQMSRKLNNYSTVGSAARYNKPIFFNQTSKPVLADLLECELSFRDPDPGLEQCHAPVTRRLQYLPLLSPVYWRRAEPGIRSITIMLPHGPVRPPACTPCHSDGGVNGQPYWTYQHATSASNRGIHLAIPP